MSFTLTFSCVRPRYFFEHHGPGHHAVLHQLFFGDFHSVHLGAVLEHVARGEGFVFPELELEVRLVEGVRCLVSELQQVLEGDHLLVRVFEGSIDCLKQISMN